MRVGQDALDRPLARPDAEPAAVKDRIARHVDLEGVARLPVEEAVDAAGDVREASYRRRSTPPTPAAPSPMIQSHGTPAMKNSAPQVIETSMVWPKSGCGDQQRDDDAEQDRWRRDCPECPAGAHARRTARRQMTTKAGFRNSDGWIDMPAK